MNQVLDTVGPGRWMSASMTSSSCFSWMLNSGLSVRVIFPAKRIEACLQSLQHDSAFFVTELERHSVHLPVCRLCPLKPQVHAHLAVHCRRRGQVLLRLLPPARAGTGEEAHVPGG